MNFPRVVRTQMENQIRSCLEKYGNSWTLERECIKSIKIVFFGLLYQRSRGFTRCRPLSRSIFFIFIRFMRKLSKYGNGYGNGAASYPKPTPTRINNKNTYQQINFCKRNTKKLKFKINSKHLLELPCRYTGNAQIQHIIGNDHASRVFSRQVKCKSYQW